jgi:hypothetical protein
MDVEMKDHKEKSSFFFSVKFRSAFSTEKTPKPKKWRKSVEGDAG